MLKKIRHALLQKREAPYPNFEEAELHPKESEPIDVLFAQRFTDVAGKFVYCEDEISFIENLISLAEREKLRRMYAWEPAVQQLLDKYGFPFYRTERDLDQIEAGITTCEALIARSGSILVSNGNASGRRLAIYPHVHVVMAFASQLVMDIKDGLSLMQRRYAEGLPSLINVITGPSRTADIEKTLVLGAHGPKEVYVFLLEDRPM
ncbi:LUD domain-containing protein [Parapedobacter sp. ISTM3]|uniref:L-lactate dehydrogenase complex protein LldG n=2 Tax=Sphingobacteriaceae TaxID=84566 RepID=A0A1T5D1X5_9SPHI|nr:LUD domain-containing protein [Parapedobacter sp. ISTM3]MBK1440533.1 LUD domain-containing protein [Parapedobacter sp. ISTM3]SKB65725.1 L-lactate dehydrogenase complex protein LldG [Parapedobacter luteus]